MGVRAPGGKRCCRGLDRCRQVRGGREWHMREQAPVTRVYDFELRSCSARHEAAPHKFADGRVPGAGLKWRRKSRWRSKSSVSRARRFPSIHRCKVLIFGISSGTVYSVGWRKHESRRKLDLLMSLAGDDREGLPPRLQHTKDVGALRPLNIRHLRPLPGTRMSLLRILMTNACSYNCHYCPMRRDRPMPGTLLKPEELVRIFPGGTSARLVRGTVHHHRHSRPPGQNHGRSHSGAGAAARAPPLCGIHPCKAGRRR